MIRKTDGVLVRSMRASGHRTLAFKAIAISAISLAACDGGDIPDTASFGEMPDFPLGMTIPDLDGCYGPVAKITNPLQLERIDGPVVRYTAGDTNTYRLSVDGAEASDVRLAVFGAFVHFKEPREINGEIAQIVDMSQPTYLKMKESVPVFVERARTDETVGTLQYFTAAYQTSMEPEQGEAADDYKLYVLSISYFSGVDGVHSITAMDVTPYLQQRAGDDFLAAYETSYSFTERGLVFSAAEEESFFQALKPMTDPSDGNSPLPAYYGPVPCNETAEILPDTQPPPSATGVPPELDDKAGHTDGREPVAARVAETSVQQPASQAAPPPQPPQIAVDKRRYQQGDAVAFSVSGLPGNRTDWITLAPKDTPPEEWGANWVYTQGVTKGDWSFVAPNAAGPYEIRVYFNYPNGGFEVQAIAEIEVFPPN